MKKTTRMLLINNAGASGNMVALKYFRLINWMTDPMNNTRKFQAERRIKL